MSDHRFLIADDHGAVRQSLETYLSEVFPQAHIEVAQNGRQALDLVRAAPPDVILLDVMMPQIDGVEATREIKARWPEVWVVALVLDLSQRDLALEAGADAWVLKGRPPGEVLDAVKVSMG
jgi:DNA-binding NarL/FixJ family response regulator